MSDIDTAVVDSLKALDPKRPIREADIDDGFPSQLALKRRQDGQRNTEFVDEARGLISQSNFTLKLVGKAINEARPKTAPGRFPNRWATPLGPCQFESLRLIIHRQHNLDAPRRIGQCAVLDRIRA